VCARARARARTHTLVKEIFLAKIKIGT